jgi:glycosyltransferase involved in cell wall biosynthesis
MKQSKVSMIVPCYNKEKYIGNMLRSVCEQTWDNIELILVNDGSADGTREIISAWEPKLRARGYAVIIVDRENAGVGAAVKAGMLRMRGEYFCTIDCDDALMSEYVSTMAGYLEEHPGYAWAMCGFIAFENIFDENTTLAFAEDKVEPGGERFLEDFMFARFGKYVWRIFTRTEYLKKCMDIEKFPELRSATHEPSFYIPLIAGSGRVKVFRDKLYRYNFGCEGLSKHTTMVKRKSYETDYLHMISIALEKTDVPHDVRNKLERIARLNALRVLSLAAVREDSPDSEFREYVDESADVLNTFFMPQRKFVLTASHYENIHGLWEAVEICLFGFKNNDFAHIRRELSSGRIIGYGALGRVAAKQLPKLAGTPLEPDLLWDVSAQENSAVEGRSVVRPAWNNLSPKDTILIFPKDADLRDGVTGKLRACGATKFLYAEDIAEYIVIACDFPEIDFRTEDFCGNSRYAATADADEPGPDRFASL